MKGRSVFKQLGRATQLSSRWGIRSFQQDSASFMLSDEIKEFREGVRAFAEAELGAPGDAQARHVKVDEENLFPADMWEKFGEMGLNGITVKEEDGGLGM